MKKLEEKHSDQIAFWEKEVKRLLNENRDHISNTQSFIKEIEDLEKEKETIIAENLKDTEIIKASC